MEKIQKAGSIRQPFLKIFVYLLPQRIRGMKIFKIAAVPLVLLSLAFSCENREDYNLSDTEKQILGQWNWIESVYYYTVSGIPYVMNPDSIGYSVYLIFKENGSFETYRNFIQESSGTYWFETIKYENGTESPLRLFTQEEEYVKSVNFSLLADTLILDETEVDGAKRIFARAR